MTTHRQRGEGNNDIDLIQIPEVTSSKDRYPFEHSRSYHHKHPTAPSARPTYRRELVYRHRLPARLITVRMMNFDPRGYNNVVNSDNISTRSSLMYLAVLFLTSLSVLGLVYKSFPDLTQEEKVHMKIPWNLDDARNLGSVLEKYKEDHFYEVYFGVSITYIFLQTFAIPGSLFLSVLSGFLFPFFQALVLVCTCSALGASLCFLISQLVGRKLVQVYFPERAKAWAATVQRHRDNLLNYVIFLRVTPFVPNWFINLTAPVIGVPLVPFALGTFVGVAPPSFIALQTGKTLNDMSAGGMAMSWGSVTLLFAFGVLSLIPIYFKDKLKTKFE